MIEATSCGGVVIFRGKILLLYKNYKRKYEGWVLPKGTVEYGEEYPETALREVKEEAGARCDIVKYVGKSHYSFEVSEGTVSKEVHWYLMKFVNEKRILEQAYDEYLELKKGNLWGKYF